MTVAEELFRLADVLLRPRARLLKAQDSQNGDEDFRRGLLIARTKLAIDFRRLVDRRPSIAIQAILEEWSQQRIHSEVY